MINNIITEVGFILIGGAFAAIPLFIIGQILKNGVQNDN